MTFSHSERLPTLWFFLALQLFLVLWFVPRVGIHLSPDEAQYWCWAQELDWGYYSKPPAIGWQIAATTWCFGNTEWGVRAGALLWGMLIPLALYRLGRAIPLRPKTSFWVALLWAFSPIGWLYGLAATTDGGMLFFLLLAMTEMARGLTTHRGPNYLRVGFWIACGALYKWPIYLFWPLTAFMSLRMPLLKKGRWGWGFLISLCAFLPILYWNAHHDWATFQHTWRTVHRSHSGHGNLLSFLGSQIGIVSPLMVVAFFWSLRESRPPMALRYLLIFPIMIGVYVILSCFKKIQPNWALFLFPSMFLWVGWKMVELRRTTARWLYVQTILSSLGVLLALAIPWWQTHSSYLPIPYRNNPFRQTMGWAALTPALEAVGYDPEHDYLFSDRYQATSLLSFYGPEQRPALFFNLTESRKNQFSYSRPLTEREQERRGFFVIVEQIPSNHLAWYQEHYSEKLSPYFASVTWRGAFPLFVVQGRPVKWALIFECGPFHGVYPPERDVY